MWSGDAPANNKSRDTFTFGLATFRIVAKDREMSLEDNAIQTACKSLEAILPGFNSFSKDWASNDSSSLRRGLYKSSLLNFGSSFFSWKYLEISVTGTGLISFHPYIMIPLQILTEDEGSLLTFLQMWDFNIWCPSSTVWSGESGASSRLILSAMAAWPIRGSQRNFDDILVSRRINL